MAQSADELREYRRNYMRTWRQDQKGKPPRSRRRPPGRPRLPKTATALDPAGFRWVATKVAGGWAQGRHWMFSPARYGWPQGEERFAELESQLYECALGQLEAICRRAPKLKTASPKTYVYKSLAKRCFPLFERILIEETWGIEDAYQHVIRLRNRGDDTEGSA